jgi:CTP-dependent riboflavin kinase
MIVSITNIRKYETKDGRQMIFLEVLDKYTVVVLPTLYKKVKAILKIGTSVRIRGRFVNGKILATEISNVIR